MQRVDIRPWRWTETIVSFCLCLLLPLGLWANPANEASDTGTILIIASYNPDTKRMTSFISDFEKRIVEKHLPYTIQIEDLGCKTISESPLWCGRMELLLARYAQQNLKAVILLGQEAWATFLSRDNFPEDIPFFGCFASTTGIAISNQTDLMATKNPISINMMQRADSLGLSGGVLNCYDVAKNIDLIRSLYPNVTTLAFLSDNTYGGISLQALIQKQIKQYPEINLILIDSRNGEKKSGQMLSELPPNSALLIGTWRVGEDGQYFMQQSLENLVACNPSLPVFSMTGSGMESVAIGGYIPEYTSGASQIADQIIGYTKHKSNAIAFIPTENKYQFNHQQLLHFDIAEYKLPKGSIITDPLEARLQQYETYIVRFSITLILLISLIIFLYYLYKRNHRLKNILENREQELIAAKEKAEESDQLKSAFLANMSHEIRTPLNAIVGFSALLGEESISTEERKEYHAIVTTNSALLLTLIGDILEISRLETGKTHFIYELTDIHALCQQVIHTTAHTRHEHVTSVLESSHASYMLYTDEQRLTQVLINLLSNANKFTTEGQITLSFEVQEQQVLFMVKDTGSGVPLAMQTKIFNRFEKLNEFKQGTGLGLAICKQIIQKFGGDIWIDPTYTEGTCFVFTHPITPPPPEPKQ